MPDTALKWIPKFVYGDAQSLELSYPVTRWNPGARTEGRTLEAIDGTPGAFLRLRKYLLGFTLRFTQDEWPAVGEFVSYVQRFPHAPFTWYPRAYDDSVSESLDVYLEAPRISEGVKPTRDSTLLWLMTTPLVISRQTAPWDIEYFRIPAS